MNAPGEPLLVMDVAAAQDAFERGGHGGDAVEGALLFAEVVADGEVRPFAELGELAADLAGARCCTAGQQPVLLRSIASLKEGTAVAQYDRYNMQRLATLTANYAGTDLGHLAEVGVECLAGGHLVPR